MHKDCLFCKIVKGEVPGKILYEDDSTLVFLDAYPDTDGHTLVIPKKHYEDIYEIPSNELMNLFEVGKKIGKKLTLKLDKSSLTFLINYGDAQAIKHIHLHLLPDFGKRTHNLSNDEVLEIMNKE